MLYGNARPAPAYRRDGNRGNGNQKAFIIFVTYSVVYVVRTRDGVRNYFFLPLYCAPQIALFVKSSRFNDERFQTILSEIKLFNNKN